MYKSLNITPHPPEIAPFKVEQSHGFLGNYYRAAFPVTHSDIHIPDPHSIGFIGKDANSCLADPIRSCSVCSVLASLVNPSFQAVVPLIHYESFIFRLEAIATKVEAITSSKKLLGWRPSLLGDYESFMSTPLLRAVLPASAKTP